ncbi:MAG: hypothetical protein N2376_11670 [Clostridia bacterium]|nr:hypothetical protein [Clostridia bacterium]
MRNSSGKFIMGAVLVIFGILMIFGNIGIFDMSWIFRLTWPMIILAFSFFFFLGYFTKRPYGTGLLVPAGIFLTLGVTFLLGEAFSYHLVWPGFIAAPAVGLLLLYAFGQRSAGLLVPIGILLTIAGTCLFASMFNAWDIAWPGFVMAPAVGLFLLYLTGKHEPGLLIPIFILTAISVTFFSIFCLGRFAESIKYILGGVLVLAGLATILRKPAPKNGYDHHDDYGGTPGM